MGEVLFNDELIEIVLTDDDIIIGTFKTEQIELYTAIRLVDSRVTVTNGEEYLIIANIQKVKSVSKEARDFLSSEKGSKGIIASAFIVDSPIGIILGNFFINISKPISPAKLFRDPLEARKWLMQHKNKDA